MSKIEIDSNELITRIENFIAARDINDGNGRRTMPIPNSEGSNANREKAINHMARELTRDIKKTNDEYYNPDGDDDFRNRA